MSSGWHSGVRDLELSLSFAFNTSEMGGGGVADNIMVMVDRQLMKCGERQRWRLLMLSQPKSLDTETDRATHKPNTSSPYHMYVPRRHLQPLAQVLMHLNMQSRNIIG